jgi:hypothetical protein
MMCSAWKLRDKHAVGSHGLGCLCMNGSNGCSLELVAMNASLSLLFPIHRPVAKVVSKQHVKFEPPLSSEALLL